MMAKKSMNAQSAEPSIVTRVQQKTVVEGTTMTDLVKRLRREADADLFGETVCAEAADRIEELEAYIKVLQDRQSKMIDDAFKRALS
jgi:hypothetical protein